MNEKSTQLPAHTDVHEHLLDQQQRREQAKSMLLMQWVVDRSVNSWFMHLKKLGVSWVEWLLPLFSSLSLSFNWKSIKMLERWEDRDIKFGCNNNYLAYKYLPSTCSQFPSWSDLFGSKHEVQFPPEVADWDGPNEVARFVDELHGMFSDITEEEECCLHHHEYDWNHNTQQKIQTNNKQSCGKLGIAFPPGTLSDERFIVRYRALVLTYLFAC